MENNNDKDNNEMNCLSQVKIAIKKEFEIKTEEKEVELGFDRKFFKKMLGVSLSGPARVPHPYNAWFSIAAGFTALFIISIIEEYGFKKYNFPFFYAGFASSTILVYSGPTSPFAQPRNLVFGHFLSALIGVIIRTILETIPHYQKIVWLGGVIAVVLATFVMMYTKTIHPPAGGTVLTAVLTKSVIDIGFIYLAFVLIGTLIILLVGLVFLNIPKTTRYPQFWI
eukprot:TRINITY_DN390_c1_g1_i1.p1 TRINITY_DN390_c1_g1~~TRINITY_DN390_c1_g1_i1.p1  ORF type:complete len:225 (+),score=37.81 TRINITY_DN390_c1_g1_i1:132-806(+)